MLLNPYQEREVTVVGSVILKMSIFHSFSTLISFGGSICVQLWGHKFQYLPPQLQEIKGNRKFLLQILLSSVNPPIRQACDPSNFLSQDSESLAEQHKNRRNS